MRQFLRGLSTTLDLKPATQAYMEQRQRAEDRRRKLKDRDEKRAYDARLKAAGLGIKVDPTEKSAEQILSTISGHQAPDVVAERELKKKADDMGMSVPEYQAHVKGKARLESPEYKQGEKARKRWNEIEKEGVEVGIGNLILRPVNDPNTWKYNPEQVDVFLDRSRKLHEAKVNYYNARSKYVSEGGASGIKTQNKMSANQSFFDKNIAAWTLELGAYPEGSPEYARIKEEIDLFTHSGGDRSPDKLIGALQWARNTTNGAGFYAEFQDEKQKVRDHEREWKDLTEDTNIGESYRQRHESQVMTGVDEIPTVSPVNPSQSRIDTGYVDPNEAQILGENVGLGSTNDASRQETDLVGLPVTGDVSRQETDLVGLPVTGPAGAHERSARSIVTTGGDSTVAAIPESTDIDPSMANIGDLSQLPDRELWRLVDPAEGGQLTDAVIAEIRRRARTGDARWIEAENMLDISSN